MKFFFYSVKGYCLSLAQRVQAEGNQVVLYQKTRNPKSKGRVGEGLVNLVHDVKIEPDTVVVFDFTGAGKEADRLKKAGYAVFGAGHFNDVLEKNRFYAMQMMKASGIKVPDTVEFHSIDQGIEYVRKHPRPLVFKPSGDHPTQLTIVGDTNDSLIKDMQRVSRFVSQNMNFALQDKVDGIEVSIEGWFNGQDWIYHSINSTLEEKRFLTGNLGPNTGCMGNVVFFYRHARPRLAKDTLLRLTSVLRRADYRGPIDINTKGGYALEFTPRFGYDAIQTAYELFNTELGRTLSDVARGQSRAFKVSFDYAIGVTMTVPPSPGDNLEELGESQGTPIRISDPLLPYFHLGDAMLDRDGTLVTAGNDGVAGVMTAVGPTVKDAKQLVYERVKQVKIPDVQYRLDIGERAIREVPQLLKEVSDGVSRDDAA